MSDGRISKLELEELHKVIFDPKIPRTKADLHADITRLTDLCFLDYEEIIEVLQDQLRFWHKALRDEKSARKAEPTQ